MRLKILVTGKNRKVASDVSDHLEKDRGYVTVKCSPSKTQLFDMTLAELPKIVIICLGDETKDTIQVYDILANAVRQGDCAAIIITNNDDEKMFIRHSELSKVSFLSRPVSLFALYEKLNDLEELFEERRRNNLSSVREYEREEEEYTVYPRKSVLIVDDDSEQLLHIKEQLEEFYNVTPVKSGEAALRYLEKHKPDIVLLDYLMPELNGPDTLRDLREIRGCEEIPVIFLTGMAEKNTVIQTLTELKPQGYIVKPSKKSEIVAKIIEVLG